MMLAGEEYHPRDPELIALYWRAAETLERFNGSAGSKDRMEILRSLMAGIAEDAWIEPPFSCEYGRHFTIGERSYLNVDCFIQDCAEVRIGSDVLIGPGVRLCTASHPLDPGQRVVPSTGPDHAPYRTFASPITVGDRVWIGASVTVLGGVTLGEGSVIGAGSVVTRDIPPGMLATGVPARVTRAVT
ncbi:sugar O-acetyltransferase [Haloferula rosea]|uniref:Sugar O-acetyltransferase n=1 Tax=Haloferula rosea TaxID=490093 RepID=A0A934RDI8_9BACT|nr:sugar O-acetyltransferase [Haloferula rosea]MBK1826596.1 sugar O-acetyltransferase [Haloferula rosea]